VALALLLAAAQPALGAQLILRVDPLRSTIALVAGSQSSLPLPQDFSGFGFGTVVMPHQPSSTGTGGTLPDGSSSNGLRTSLSGFVVIDLDSPPSLLQIKRQSSSIDFDNSGTWLPGLPGTPTAAAPGEIAVEFGDTALASTWNGVLRDVSLSVSTEGVASALTPTAANTWSFPAGCNLPLGTCPVFRIEESNLDASNSPGGGMGRLGFRSPGPAANPAGNQATLVQRPDGKFELTIPIAFTSTIDPFALNDPLGTTHTLVWSGQIVAVPEPRSDALACVALAVLAGLAGLRRVGRRRSALFAAGLLCLSFSLGCHDDFDPTIQSTSYMGTPWCGNEMGGVDEITGSGSRISLLTVHNATCKPGGTSATGFVSGGQTFTYFSESSYSDFTGAKARFAVGTTVNPASFLAQKLGVSLSSTVTYSYAPATGSQMNPPQLAFMAKYYSLGSAIGEVNSGAISIGGMQFAADGMWHYYTLSSLGGTVDVTLSHTGERQNAGIGYHGVAAMLGIRTNTCGTNLECGWKDGANPYCEGNGACGDGGLGKSCTHKSQCGIGYSCNLGVCVGYGF